MNKHKAYFEEWYSSYFGITDNRGDTFTMILDRGNKPIYENSYVEIAWQAWIEGKHHAINK